jgi:hypothetical protein
MDITPAWFHRLKAAQRDLIGLAGGIERAAGLTSMSKSQVGRWNNPTDTEIMSVPAALLLEADCEQPLFTAVMAGLNGRRLTDPDTGAAKAGNLLASHAEVVRTFAELMTQSAQSLADGSVSPAEAAAWDRALSALQQAVDASRKQTAGARATGFSVVGGAA